jgi:hypothetical protein
MVVMKINIVAIIWKDIFAYDDETLDEETFSLATTLQVGLLYDEDNEKLRLVHGYSLEHDEHDFIVIPKSLVIEQKVLGTFNTNTKEITVLKN